MKKERNISLDVIRILACCMIVFMHSPIPSENVIGPYLMGISYFTAPGIGLFFMVSGALLMPTSLDYFAFLRRRLSKILLPTLIWTGIYLSIHLYYSYSEINLLKIIMSVPFSVQGNGVLWFMYTMAGIYLLTPILSAWIKNASVREIEFVLLLWCVSLCYPLLDNFVEINTGTTGILYYFTGYAGYFLLGYYLKNHQERIALIFPLAISILGVGLLLYLKFKNIEFDFYEMFWYLSIFVAAMCCTLWILIMKFVLFLSRFKKIFSRRIRNFVIILSNISFGIYLIHILIMRYWLWNMEWINNISNYILQTNLIALITLGASALVCYIMANIPILNILVGCRLRHLFRQKD